MQTNYTLNELEGMLGQDGFFRCSKSFVVNLDKIVSLRSEMGITSYLMAIGQRLLFSNKKICRKLHPVIRNILWTLIPVAIMVTAQFVLGWFGELPNVAWISFDLILVAFLAIVEVLIHKFYKDDTKVLNELLMQYQGGKKN